MFEKECGTFRVQRSFGTGTEHFAAKFAKYRLRGGLWSFTTFTDAAFAQRSIQTPARDRLVITKYSRIRIFWRMIIHITDVFTRYILLFTLALIQPVVRQNTTVYI